MDRAKTWVFGERVINFEEVHNVHFVEAENFYLIALLNWHLFLSF